MARSQKRTPASRSTKKVKSVISSIITIAVAAVAFAAYVIDGGVEEASGTPTSSESSVAANAPAASSETAAEYRAMLASLDVKGRAPGTGYERELFGPAWTDTVSVEYGHNGCDTRNDILQRDLDDIQLREGTKDCIVTSGLLSDPFSGELIDFVRGERSGDVQIDHLVPLHDAWVKGAQQWDEQTRKNFANDPDNLLAVKGTLNQQKGAGDAATWLPPNTAFRCDYAKKIITVKDRYKVWVTEAEASALERQLDTCAA